MNAQRTPDDEQGFRHAKRLSPEELEELFAVEHDNNDDPVEALQRKKKIRVAIISALLLVVLAAAGFLIYRVYSAQLEEQERREAEEQRAREEAEAEAAFEPDLPLLDAYGDSTVPSTTVDTITLDVNDDGEFVSSEDATLSHSEHEFAAAEVQCSVSRSTDFCFAGELENDSDQNVHVYFLKDAPNSRLLETPADFEVIDVYGADMAAVMTIELGGQPTPTLVTVHDDGTGYMITTPGASLDTVQSLAEQLELS